MSQSFQVQKLVQNILQKIDQQFAKIIQPTLHGKNQEGCGTIQIHKSTVKLSNKEIFGHGKIVP